MKKIIPIIFIVAAISIVTVILLSRVNNERKEDTFEDASEYSFAHLDNILICGEWVANFGETEYEWNFYEDDSFEYFKNGNLIDKGKYLYIDIPGDSYTTSNEEGTVYLTHENQSWDEIILFYDGGGQNIIKEVYPYYDILRMNLATKAIYFINKESDLIE